MKRIGNLWHQVINFENLFQAYKKARKGKSKRQGVAEFSFNLEYELLTLQRELVNESYQPGKYRQFIIRERKKRLISAAPFRDRVVHHAVMNILEPVFDKRFYFHSYACRKDKGVHKAVNQYQNWNQQFRYVLKLDISRYFPSICHTHLKIQYRKIIKDQSLLNLLDQIIDASPCTETAIGLPIGNLTSQYFANLYLNDIDHWLCSIPETKGYLRYVDDLVIFSNQKQDLWNIKARLDAKLAELGLSLHTSKQQLMHCRESVDVLGYKVSKNKRWLRNDNGYRFQRKLKQKAKSYANGNLTMEDINPSIQSWIGHAKHAETMGLRTHIFKNIVFQREQTKREQCAVRCLLEQQPEQFTFG